MSHDRGCFKCGKDQWEYDQCKYFDCVKKINVEKVSVENPPSKAIGTKQETDDMITKTIKWTTHSSKEILLAGGNPESVLGTIPDDVLITLIRNDLYLSYKGNKTK